MAMRIKLSPKHAHIPEVLKFFLLRPGKPLRYWCWTRFWDRWSGRKDRTDASPAPSNEPAVADTPWLTRLTNECGNAIASERIRSEALVAVIDREQAELEARLHRIEAIVATSQAELKRLGEAPIADSIEGAGEQYSPVEERLQRRRRERARAIAALEGKLNSANAETLEIKARLEVLAQERRSHWVVLQERARNLTKHYIRRASTYVRAMEHRRDGVTCRVPDIPSPAWVVAELGSGGLAH